MPPGHCANATDARFPPLYGALLDQDGYVVVIKIYMDESGTHHGSPIVTVGAYAGQPKHWKAFTKEWNAKKRQDGVKIYHATDCANQAGEFEAWTKPQCDAFASKMLPVIAAHPPIGILVGIDMKAYDEAIAPHPHLRSMFGTPYAACFQWVVQTFLGKVEEYGSNERLAFFHEQNDFQKEASESFDWVVKQRTKHSSLMTLKFGTKEEFTPLQAADVLAYEGNKRLRGIRDGRPKRRAYIALDPEEKRLTVLQYGKRNMPWLIERLQLSHEQIKKFGQIF